MSFETKLLEKPEIDAFQHILNSMFFPFYTTAGFDYLLLSLDNKRHHSLYKFYIKFTLFCVFLCLAMIFYATRNYGVLISVIVFGTILAAWDEIRLWSVSHSVIYNDMSYFNVNYKKDTLEIAEKLTYARLILNIIFIIIGGVTLNRSFPKLYQDLFQDITSKHPNKEE